LRSAIRNLSVSPLGPAGAVLSSCWTCDFASTRTAVSNCSLIDGDQAGRLSIDRGPCQIDRVQAMPLINWQRQLTSDTPPSLAITLRIDRVIRPLGNQQILQRTRLYLFDCADFAVCAEFPMDTEKLWKKTLMVCNDLRVLTLVAMLVPHVTIMCMLLCV
jgi:hypothetical protein